MLERVLVALLAGGHVLLEGVPGLAKTLTVKTVADVLGGSFKRLQFTPDLVPADLVGTRIYRPDTGDFDTELGPVFCNFLLADEINRAPAKVQSALLEVMQERQVTIGHETHQVPAAVPRARDAEPDRVRGHLPAARGPGRPLHVQARRRLPDAPRRGLGRRALARQPTRTCARCSRPRRWRATSAPRGTVYVDRRVMEYAVALTTATREPGGGELGRVRRLAARLDQPDPRRPRAGAAARARLHAAASTCATSRATCCATASCSPTRRWPPAWTPTACSTTCSSACRCRASSSRTARSAFGRELPRAPAAARCWRWSRWRAGGLLAGPAPAPALRRALHASACWPASPAARGRRHVPGAARAARARRAADRARAAAAHGGRRAATRRP